MKRVIFLLFSCFHLAFLILNNASVTRETYLKFFNKKGTYVDSIVSRVIRHSAFLTYGRLTGLETGYGFFGFNVRSTGFVLAENCGEVYYPKFRTLEGENRYSGLRGIYIDYLEYMHPVGREKHRLDSLQEKYLDLVLKNVTAFSLRDKPLACDSTFSGYYILEIPTLKEVRSGTAPMPSLLPVKKLAYVVRKEYPQ